MKKMLLALALLASSTSVHAANKLGLFLPGVQYEHDLNPLNSFRLGVSIPLVLGNSTSNIFGLYGDAAYLHHTAEDTARTQPYFGGGVGVFGLRSSGYNYTDPSGSPVSYTNTAVVVYPHILGGINFNYSPNFSTFTEISVGPLIAVPFSDVGSSTSTQVFPGAAFRVGLNYTFR